MIFSEKIKNCKINGKKCRIKNGENLIFDENLDFTLDSGGNSFTIKITPKNPNNYDFSSGGKIDPEILLETVRIPAKFRNKTANIADKMTDSNFLYINCLFFEEGVTKTSVDDRSLAYSEIKIVYVPSTKTDGTGFLPAARFYCNFSKGEKEKPSKTAFSCAYNKEIRFSDNIILSCDKNDNTVSIAGYDKFIFDSTIKLPNYLYYNNDYRYLCGFDDYSFVHNRFYSDVFDKSCLKKITITSGYDRELKKIGNFSFYGNEFLETVPFSYISEICASAFGGTAITTGSNSFFGEKSGIKTIGRSAFYKSTGAILNFYVNNRCDIGADAFANGSQTSIGFKTSSNKCITLGVAAFARNKMKTFYASSYADADELGDCSAIKDLSNNAFDECVNLYGGKSYSDLYFNTIMKDIPYRCFYKCKNLHNIHVAGGNVQLYSEAIYDAGFNAFTRSDISYSPQIIVLAGDSYRVSEYDTGTSSYGCSNSAYSASKYESGNLFEVKYSLN